MQHGGAELRVRFYLSAEGEFHPGREVIQKIPRFKELAAKGEIDLYTTDGALSIVYGGDELLGVDCWDEINQFCRGLVYGLQSLTRGDAVEEFMPMQSLSLRLRPVGVGTLLYELESKTARRPLHLRRTLPRNAFIREIILAYLRLMKVLATLGSRSFSDEEEDWAREIPRFVAHLVDPEDLLRIRRTAKGTLDDLASAY